MRRGQESAHMGSAAIARPALLAVGAVVAVAAGVVLYALSSGGPPPPTSRPDAGPAAVNTAVAVPLSPTRVASTGPTGPTGPTPSRTSSKAVPPVQPAAASPRKGVCVWKFGPVASGLRAVGASWYYNWSASNATMPGPAGVEFVPMIWGAGSVTDGSLASAKAGGHALLGFNEPDLGEQANMSVEQALDLWPRLQATGLRLGSPAPAWGGADAGGWLDRFMAGARQRGYRVDFIALHWYGSDFSAAAVGHLKSYLEAVHRRYNKPIWLTEFALIRFDGGATYPTDAQQSAFIAGATAMIDDLPYVERYAWFGLPASPGSGTGL